MLTEIHVLNHIPPSKLDEYLAMGWFRMGQTIFTCHLLCFNNEIYSTVWTRLALQNFQFKKSLRKILKRNDQRFRTVVRRAVFDYERQHLYHLHKERFEGYVPGTLEESLFGMENRNIYQTLEVAIYDGKRLIGVSFFDLGRDSIASIMALFDPSYARYSLGMYTMLKEIQYGIDTGRQFYYPGYVVPRYGKFDYKLRLGEMEFLDVPSGQWCPIPELNINNLPAETITQKLRQVSLAMQRYDLAAKQLTYPFYDKDLFGYEEEEFLQSPIILDCSPENYDETILFVEYHYLLNKYRLAKGIRTFNSTSIFMSSFMDKFDPARSCLDIISIDKVIVESREPEVIADRLRKIL